LAEKSTAPSASTRQVPVARPPCDLSAGSFFQRLGNLIQAAGPVDVYGIDKNVGLKLFIGKFSLDF
jgi:hypothetical protein